MMKSVIVIWIWIASIVQIVNAKAEWSALFKSNITSGRNVVATAENARCSIEDPILSMEQLKQLFRVEITPGWSDDMYHIQATNNSQNKYSMMMDFREGTIEIAMAARTPPWPHVSQIIASFWSSTPVEKEIENPTKNIVSMAWVTVVQDKAKAIVKEILDNNDLKEGSFDGYPFAYGSDEYYALLATPVGLPQAYSLAKHRSVFGKQRIDEIIIKGPVAAFDLEFNMQPASP